MTNEIIEAISTRLGTLFPDWHCYAQDTLQNIECPCFIIKLVDGMQRELLGNRVRLKEIYSVNLICPDDVFLLRDVLESAALNLRFIDMPDGKPLFAEGRNHQIINDETAVITFSISRSAVYQPDEDPKQERLIHSIGVKHEQNQSGQ